MKTFRNFIVEGEVIPFPSGRVGSSRYHWTIFRTYQSPTGTKRSVIDKGFHSFPNDPDRRHAAIHKMLDNHITEVRGSKANLEHVVKKETTPLAGRVYATHWMDDPDGNESIMHVHRFEKEGTEKP